MLEPAKIIELTSKTIDDFSIGYIEAGEGYKFRTKLFLDVLFLYINSVDVKNPDLLGKTNKNTYIYEVQDEIQKIKEQVRLDIKDINFLVNGASSLSRFIAKAANRKVLKENQFATEMDNIADDGVDFGSGFLKVWRDGKGKLNLRSVDPYKLIFDQYNFKEGLKIERLRRTYRQILADEKYDADVRNLLAQKISDDEKDKSVVIYQVLKPNVKGGNDIYIVDIENELVYYKFENDENVQYYKWDYEKRKGFPDALGRGANERVFNVIVQSKVNRTRMDEVMAVASKLPLQKEIDHEKENLVGKSVVKLKTGQIMGHKGNAIETMNLGGDKQVAFITNQLNELTAKASTLLNVGDALQGNTLPSGTSGALGNLLTENASSVHKEVQKHFAQFLSGVYNERITPFILSVFDKLENIEKHLDPNDIRMVRESVIDYLTLQKQIDAAILDQPFNIADAKEEVKQDIKGRDLISGDLLDKLKGEVKGIETFITGEKKSKAQTVAFLREIRNTYLSNPDAFQQPFFVELLKKEAEHEAGISGLEIDNLLKELTQ